MTNRYAVLIMLFLATISSAVRADDSPTLKGTVRPTPSEAKFVSAMQADLNHRFATPAAAEAAGYFRYTNADDTGAISYANLHWASSDVHHPSQLWYDKRGNLLGADYSILKTKRSPSARLGNSARALGRVRRPHPLHHERPGNGPARLR